MFSFIDLVIGAIAIRISRVLKKLKGEPDISFVTDKLAVGGYSNYKLLVGKIDAVVDLRLESPSLENIAKELKLDYVKVGVKDASIPSLEQLNFVINWIEEKIKLGKRVLVHCNLGRGRAPLVVCALLCKSGIPLDECINLVKKRRRFIFLNEKQLRFLRLWVLYNFS